MGTFTVSHRGEQYEVDADDQASAEAKLNGHFAEQNKNESSLTHVMRRVNEALGIKEDAAVNPPGFTSAMVKGVPVLGNMVPESKNLTDLEQNHPVLNKTANVLGGGMAMLAPATKAAQLGAKIAPGLLGEVGAQSTLGVGTNLADKVAEKGTATSMQDLQSAALIGAGQGAAGPLLGKAISPTLFHSSAKPAEALAHLPEKALEDIFKKGAAKDAVHAILSHPMVTGAAGLASSHLTGVHPITSAAIGLMAPAAVKKWGSNELMHNAKNKAILDALVQGQGTQYQRE